MRVQKTMKKIDLLKCLSIITKDGLRTQKFKNSHLQLISSAEEGRRGSVFAYRSKANMVKARGVVLTSIESLLENQDQFTHWTPIATEAIVMLVDGLHVGTLKIILDRLTHSTLTSILPLQLKK